MTYKQIIIDNVDVSGCEFLDGKYCKLCDVWAKLDNVIVNRQYCDRTINKNCNYKQLKRKEQERKALREDIKDIANLLDLDTDEEYNFGDIELEIKQLKAKEQECEELKREKRNFYKFLTNKYNYGSFRPMWGAYLLRRFFKEDLGDFFNKEAYKMADTIEEEEKQLDQLKAENEKLKDKLNCCFCNPHAELNDTEKLRKCLEVTECFRRQLDQLKAENDDLKKQLESTKGLVTVGNKQLMEALKENEELNKINDEKNELLAKLGCPTTATAKRKVLCLQQQIDKLKEDNEALRKNILLKCPNCGEEYLSPEGAALYEENTNLKKRLKEVENESNI